MSDVAVLSPREFTVAEYHTTVKGVTIGELNGKTAITVHKSLTEHPG